MAKAWQTAVGEARLETIGQVKNQLKEPRHQDLGICRLPEGRRMARAGAEDMGEAREVQAQLELSERYQRSQRGQSEEWLKSMAVRMTTLRNTPT